MAFERMVRSGSGSESASVFQSVSRSESDPGLDCDSDTDSEKTRHEGSPTPRFAGQAEATASSRGRLQRQRFGVVAILTAPDCNSWSGPAAIGHAGSKSTSQFSASHADCSLARNSFIGTFGGTVSLISIRKRGVHTKAADSWRAERSSMFTRYARSTSLTP